MKKNIFVIGDLIIDHTVFVKEPLGPYQAASGETVYQVIRRQDTAGGAANVARILAVLNEGRTYLWGVAGTSHWGNFRNILESSQLLDGARSNIELRGVQDETAARMNTITRLIFLKDDGRIERKIRFDDVDRVHVPDDKRRFVMSDLDHVHNEKDPLDAIIINDLDKKCITKDIAKTIAEFAEKNHIPLFVDPKRERSKYTDIKGTAILPNLREWCYLVEDSDRYNFWRTNLDSPDVLTEMAHRSFRYLGNFKYHIIKCDILGCVIIVPHPKRKHLYAVYRAKATEAYAQTIDNPLGCGDIMIGVFAAEYDKSREEADDCTDMILNAFHLANIAVGCYCDMPWHRMPGFEEVKKRQIALANWIPKLLAEPSKGMLYLPQKGDIVLSDFEAIVPRIYSTSSTLHDKLKALVEEATAHPQKVTPKSIMLGAPSGSGKSTIIEGLLRVLPQFETPVLQCPKNKLGEFTSGTPGLLKEWIQQTLSTQVAWSITRCLVIVDEAYSDHFSQKGLLDLLQWAHSEGIRFLFVDSLFCTGSRQNLKIMSDIQSRCSHYELPGISERPGDIPYFITNKLLECAEADGIRTIRLEGKLILFVTDRILEDGNPRSQLNALTAAYNNAKKSHQPGQPLFIRLKNLDDKFITPARSSIPTHPDSFTVVR